MSEVPAPTIPVMPHCGCGHRMMFHDFGNGKCKGWVLGMPCECVRYQEAQPEIQRRRSLVDEFTVPDPEAKS
jgi:hypothetical protein